VYRIAILRSCGPSGDLGDVLPVQKVEVRRSPRGERYSTSSELEIAGASQLCP
jgi:hypothetical protein